MTDTFDLTQEALLVRLYIGQGGLTSRSNTLTREAAEAHNADSRSVAGVVYILTAEDRKAITKSINEARAFFYSNTLPWDDNAYRLVPVTRYAHLKRELQRIENEFADNVEKLLADYDSLRKDYHRRVNDLALEVPFPTKEEFRGSFKFNLLESPIASPHDIRLKHVSNTAISEIKSKVAAQMNERLAAATAHIVERLKESVKRLHDQTASKDARLFKSLVANIEEDCDVLPKLNLTNDPEINRLIERVKGELVTLDVATMKANDKFRAQAHKAAKSVLDDLQAYDRSKIVAVPKASAKTIKEADESSDRRAEEAKRELVTAESIVDKAIKVQGKAKKAFDFGKFTEYSN